MADIDILPQDVIDELKASGVKFDEDGNIIEEQVTQEENDPETDENDDSGNDDDTEQGDADEDVGDDDADELSDEVDDEPPVKKVKPVEKTKLKLTPRKSNADDPDKDELLKLRRDNEELQAQLAALTKDDASKPEDSMKTEALRFKHLRLREFKNSVSRSVDSLGLGATFNDIIASEEWPQYLNTKVFGSKVSDMLKNAIEESNLDDVISFYTDFSTRFLPSVAKTKQPSPAMRKVVKNSNSEKLADLATPNKTQADRKSGMDTSRKAYLYNESDYETMLSKAERGQMPYSDFVKFETKFDAARKAGRVKPSV
jgi:hypothetical protein